MHDVSVVIPTWNRASTIRAAIRSAFEQSVAALEVIVVDDGSTDRTPEILAGERERWGGRLRIIGQEHAERSIARNRGISAATGRYIAFLDSDDVWRPSHLEQTLNALVADPTAVAAAGDFGIVSNHGRVIQEHVARANDYASVDVARALDGDDRALLRALAKLELVLHPSDLIASRLALLSTGGFDPDLVVGEDWQLWIRLASAGRLILTHTPTVWHRGSPDSSMSRPAAFARGIRSAAERVIDTGAPARVGVDDDLVRASACVHAALAFAFSRRPRPMLRMLAQAVVHYPPVVAERQFLWPSHVTIYHALRRRRTSPEGSLLMEAIDRPAPSASSNVCNSPLVSVVIPVRDMEDTIGAQLAALARQDFSGSWEIIVADNGSRDATGRIAEQWRDRLPILLVDASGPADAGYARNMGVRAALGELLLFCDADDEVRPEWLRLLAGALGRNAVAVGRIDHAKFNSPRLARAADQPLVGCGFLPPGGACNLGIRRSVFDQLGGFPEGYLRMEDTALLFRAQLGGHELAFEESAVVDRRLKAVTPRQMFALHLRAGRSVVRMYKDFHGVGMPHSPLRDLVYDYLSIPARLAAGRRKQAAEVAGWRLGRLLGSLRAGTLYL